MDDISFERAPSEQLKLPLKTVVEAVAAGSAASRSLAPATVTSLGVETSAGDAPPYGPPTARLDPGATMAQLLELVTVDEGLPAWKRRNVASSIRKFVEHQGLDLHMQADFPTYRESLKRFNPTSARVSKARWSNIKSDVTFALKRYGGKTRASLPKKLSPAWRALREALADLRLHRGLSRFIHWCSAEGIAPDAVDDAVMARFHRYMIEETFEKKPNHIFRDTAMLWNRAVAEVRGWPKRPVAVPSFRNVVSRSLADFPILFREALDRYAHILSGQDLAAPNLPARPLKKDTIEQHEQQLRRFASAMVNCGRPIEEIDGIAALLATTPWFEQTMQAEFERLGGPRPSLQELAATLLAVSRHHLGLPEERIEEIGRIKKRLTCRPRGFTEKNRERLRPFSDPFAQARFLYLGEKLLKLSTKASSPKKAALLVQTALAHEILIAAPMRFGNLVGLNTRRHFRFSGSGRTGKSFIVIPGHEVKNGVDLEFELPADVVRLLKVYLDTHRPALVAGEDEGWLFPGEKPGTRKHQVTLSGQLVKSVAKHAGLTVNPHLYRHLAAYFFLQSNPGEFETVRRLLGHKSIETTSMFYADFDRSLSIKRYQDSVLERKGALPPGGRGRRRKKRMET